MTAADRPVRRLPGHRHVRLHARFYTAALFGVLAGLATGDRVQDPVRLMLAGDGFFALYLALVAVMAVRMTPARLRDRASSEDVGLALILLLTMVAVSISLASIFSLLHDGSQTTDTELTLAVASVLLAWMTLHTVVTFHYAHRYYQRAAGATDGIAGGLQFPGTAAPGFGDFLYFAVVIGMTAQVSDVQVTSSTMRRLVLIHGVLSFLFNTVLLALAVNVAASQFR
jgi:uncharacterized membrane protein